MALVDNPVAPPAAISSDTLFFFSECLFSVSKNMSYKAKTFKLLDLQIPNLKRKIAKKKKIKNIGYKKSDVIDCS